MTRGGHARAFLARAEAIEPMLFAPQAEQHCDLLEFDPPDHDAALGWFLVLWGGRGGAAAGGRAVFLLVYPRMVRDRVAVAACDAGGEARSSRGVRLRAEVGLAQLAFIAGDYLASFAAIESALPVARLLGDDVVLARCLATAGYVWWFLDPERSAALFEEGLAAARRSGDGWTRSTGLAGLGWARYFAGRFDAAIELFAGLLSS